MGNDGGSIPKRRELVKEAARLQTAAEAKESLQEQQGYKWTTCPLSQEPLKFPVVSDSMGSLYNKDAILSFLLPSDDPIDDALKLEKDKLLGGRVKSLKDVIEVKFQTQESDNSGEKANGNLRRRAGWVCPISHKELGPTVKSAYIVPCGHAFSEVAVKEVLGGHCSECNEPYSAENVIPILPISASEIERLIKRSETLKEQGLTHSLKKASGSSKKRKKHTTEAPKEVNTTNSGSDKPTKGLEPQQSENSEVSPANNAIKNMATANLTTKVLAEEQEKAKRRKLEPNDNIKSLFSSSKKQGKSNGDFMTRGFSIPANTQR